MSHTPGPWTYRQDPSELRTMGVVHDDNGVSFPTKSMFETAKAAIAKAEGEAHNG